MTSRSIPPVLALAVSLSACYTYTAQGPGAAPGGAEVHVEIESSAVERITAQLGPRVQTLDGRLLASTDSTLTVSVETITRAGGSEERWNGDAVRLPRSALARVQVRRFDALRTTLIAGGIVGAALVAARGGTSAPTTGIRGGGSSGAR